MNSGDIGDSNGRNNNTNIIPNNIINHNSIRESEIGSRSGSDTLDNIPVSGDDLDLYQDNSGRRKKYERHSPQQIHELEMFFKECSHPDEKHRQELSRRLKLDTRQVKFWFQNRRTQMKMQIEHHENSILKNEKDRLLAENLKAKEAMRNSTCNKCGRPVILGRVNPNQLHLIVENISLKNKLERICALAGKFLGYPLHHNLAGALSNGFAHQIAPTLSTVPDYVSSLGNNQLVVASSNNNSNAGVDGSIQSSMLLELASVAMDELMKMAQMEEPLWMKDGENGRKILNFEEYGRRFARCIGPKPVGYVAEVSRESGVVVANSSTLVEILMDANRWVDMFPSLIANTNTTEVISSGMGGTRNGALQLMQASFHVLSPLVPNREFKFLRFCKQHAYGIWAIVDVSIDGVREFPTATNGNVSCRRLPSGCIMQDTPNGYSKVTWVEHTEYDESRVHQLYRPLLRSGLGLGAQCWLATLQRQCECLAIPMPSSAITRDQTGMTTRGMRSMLKLAQRMTRSFCAGVSVPSSAHKWSKIASDGRNINENIRMMTRESMNDPGEPHGIIISAATSVSLPLSPQRIFDFLRDVNTRSKWDILANGGPMQEMSSIVKGQNPGNAVSLLRSTVGNESQSSMLILQETCTDASGSLVVYAPVEIPAMELVMNGGDSANVALLPSGLAIVPDGPYGDSSKPGSLLTVAFQILVNSHQNAKLSAQSVEPVNNLITSSVRNIKDALKMEK